MLDEDDPLTILMAFSGDPVGVIQPLIELIKQVEKIFQKQTNKLVAERACWAIVRLMKRAELTIKLNYQ